MDRLHARLTKASQAFYGYYKILCNRCGSIKTRLNLLNSYVAGKWLWMAPNVRPTKAVARALDTLQTTFLTSIVGLAYDPLQSVVENWVSRRRASKVVAQILEHGRWSARQAISFFRYWGHVARYDQDLDVPSATILQVRDTRWLWTHPGERRVLGNWPDIDRFLQINWEQHMCRNDFPRHVTWTDLAKERGQWEHFLQAWLVAKNLHLHMTYPTCMLWTSGAGC